MRLQSSNFAFIYSTAIVCSLIKCSEHRRISKNSISLLNQQQKLGSFFDEWNDEYWRKMWYLNPRVDVMADLLGVHRVWNAGYTGKGVIVGVLDTGIDVSHPEFEGRFVANLSFVPSNPVPYTDHGTKCAAIIAAKPGNRVCGVGIAFDAKLSFIRAALTQLGLAELMVKLAVSPIDIYSISLGGDDDGRSINIFDDVDRALFSSMVLSGRNGKGSIAVVAAGNGGLERDHCSCDGLSNLHHLILVNSIQRNGQAPIYAEKCAAIMTSSFTSSDDGAGIFTAGPNGTCIEDFSGTSASTPIVAGIIALALEANPDLDYRQIQTLTVLSSKRYDFHDSLNWRTNGAGFWVSDLYGFGLLNAKTFVDKALRMKGLKSPPLRKCFYHLRGSRQVRRRGKFRLSFEFNTCANFTIRSLEHVILKATIVPGKSNPGRRGALEIMIKSPTGPPMYLLRERPRDMDRKIGFPNWSFTSVLNWFEDPRGYWSIAIYNHDSKGFFRFRDLELILHGIE